MERIDSRVKVVSVLFLSILTFLYPLQLLFLFLFFLFLLYLISKASIKALMKNVISLKVLLILIVLVEVLFTKGETLFKLGIFNITYEGVEEALIFLGRIFSLVTLGTFLSQTTSSLELAKALQSLLSFLKFFKVPVEKLTLSLSLSWRFIPILFKEGERIKKSLVVRGLNPKSFWEKIRMSRNLAFPLLVGVLRQADELGEALEVRGVGEVPLLLSEEKRVDLFSIAVFIFLLLFAFSLLWWGS